MYYLYDIKLNKMLFNKFIKNWKIVIWKNILYPVKTMGKESSKLDFYNFHLKKNDSISINDSTNHNSLIMNIWNVKTHSDTKLYFWIYIPSKHANSLFLNCYYDINTGIIYYSYNSEWIKTWKFLSKNHILNEKDILLKISDWDDYWIVKSKVNHIVYRLNNTLYDYTKRWTTSKVIYSGVNKITYYSLEEENNHDITVTIYFENWDTVKKTLKF